MNITSTNLIAKDTKENIMATKVGAVNNAATNGTNNTANNNAAVTQPKAVPQTDTVELSQNGVALAATAKVEEVTPQFAMTKEESIKVAKADVKQSMRDNQQELKSLVKDLKASGMDRREVKDAVKLANKAANKEIAKEIKQAYKDFTDNKINESQLTDKLYGAAVKKLDSIVSALRDALAQKVAPEDKNTEAVKERAAETTEKATPPGLAMKGELPPRLTIKAEKEAAKVAEDTAKDAAKAIKDAVKDNGNSGVALGAINANEKADKAFARIVDFFNGIDKIVNGFVDDKVEGKDSNDKGDSLLNFVSRLNDMVSGLNKVFGNQSDEEEVGNRLGVAQIDKEAIGHLFDNGHGSGAINRIGDAGEGSGNFNTASFMSSMSSGINDALNTYKEVQAKVEQQKEAKEEAKAEAKEAAKEEVDGVLA